ncbi:hypothetical protein SESBI_12500 [Sesbania bispinosa]|nr:hypothetical protein SESBI_12500 [Sesbania bispinosa]
MRREPRCTSWFCVLILPFSMRYLMTQFKLIGAKTFADTVGAYHHFEWAVGKLKENLTFGIANVGMNGCVQVSGLDLGG